MRSGRRPGDRRGYPLLDTLSYRIAAHDPRVRVLRSRQPDKWTPLCTPAYWQDGGAFADEVVQVIVEAGVPVACAAKHLGQPKATWARGHLGDVPYGVARDRVGEANRLWDLCARLGTARVRALVRARSVNKTAAQKRPTHK